ncbi:uncharacterized protein METZ01_LOCUS489828, partial [marine metagenome]
EAAGRLEKNGIGVRVLDMHTIKPIDRGAILEAASETGRIMTVEEHNIIGGLGSAVAEVLVDCKRVPFLRHGVKDEFVLIGPPAGLYAHYRLDAPGIVQEAHELMEKVG